MYSLTRPRIIAALEYLNRRGLKYLCRAPWTAAQYEKLASALIRLDAQYDIRRA